MSDTRVAPWTEAEVKALHSYQHAGSMHPYTCGAERCRSILIATAEGWACPHCAYRQNWCHAIHAEPFRW
jgi:hypothetical protein